MAFSSTRMTIFAWSAFLCIIGLWTESSADPLWGTFRPHTLISARAAVPHSPYFGFVYHPADELDIRHLTTENHDKIKLFSWKRHNGSFGDQIIQDEAANLALTSHFLAHPDQASACVLRITAVPLDPSRPVKPISVIFYAVTAPEDIDPLASSTTVSPEWGVLKFDGIQSAAQGVATDVRILGNASNIGGSFRLRVHQPRLGTVMSMTDTISDNYEGLSSRSLRRTRAERPSDDDSFNYFHISSPATRPETAWAVEKHLPRVLRRQSTQERAPHVYTLDGSTSKPSSVAFVQRVLQTQFELDATFVLTENRDITQVEQLEKDLTGSSLDSHLQNARDAFDQKFEAIFKLRERGVSEEEEAFARTSLSNLMGGVGYFYGSSIIKETSDPTHGKEIKPGFLNPVGLLTATPSRATFPRGFLWDEGFHQLIIQRWDPELSQKCMESWFRASQENGWIPREQILGFEARNRFPQHVQHLMIQNPLIANPPTILMPLRLLSISGTPRNITVRNCEADMSRKNNAGSETCSSAKQNNGAVTEGILRRAMRYYEWLKESQSGEINGSFRWRGRSSEQRSPDGYPLTLASGLDDYPRAEFPSSYERHVDLHSWMTWASGTLAELTEHLGEDPTSYKEEHERLKKSLIELHGTPITNNDTKRENLLLCDFDGEDRVCHEGYVTILPLVLGLLEPSDARLSAIFDSLENPESLLAKGGLRSLSKSNKWYRKGDDYWTGSIWMPFNFLTLAALRTKYSVKEGPYQERAKKLCETLKQSILDNTFRVYSETGQLWENYSPDEDGKGKSGRQFTGWSALTLLMYADMFDGVV